MIKEITKYPVWVYEKMPKKWGRPSYFKLFRLTGTSGYNNSSYVYNIDISIGEYSETRIRKGKFSWGAEYVEEYCSLFSKMTSKVKRQLFDSLFNLQQ